MAGPRGLLCDIGGVLQIDEELLPGAYQRLDLAFRLLLEGAPLLAMAGNRYFLEGAAALGLPPAEVVMVGDDVDSDVNGALAAGLQAVLVRTGKYRPGDQQRAGPGALVMESLAEVADWLLSTGAAALTADRGPDPLVHGSRAAGMTGLP